MASTNDVARINEIIKDFLDAYQHRDIEALGAAVANDEQFIAFGTDEGEIWHGWTSFKSAAEKLFGAMEEIHWERGKTPFVNFSRDGSVAWFAEELEGCFVTFGEKHACKFRFSGVAERKNDGWKIVQFHRSVPVEDHAVPYLETHGVRFD
jgi:ketosteroid isomerase-like protein